MPAFDFHQHLWPEPFVAALSQRKEPPRLRGSTLELVDERPYEVDLGAHRLDERLRSLDADGIDAAVVCLQPTLGIERLPASERQQLHDAYHEGILELAEASDGRILALAAESVVDGTVGASVGADRIALAELEALFEELEQRGSVLFVHPGPAPGTADDPVWWPALVAYTAQMQEAYLWWVTREPKPRLRVLFAIMAGGAPIQLERLRSRGVDPRVALDPNIFLETSSYGRRAFELCFATFGAGQLVYGSDSPVTDSQLTLQEVRSFGQAVENAVLRDNPARVLS